LVVALSIKDPETDRLIRDLAALTGESMTEAVRKAVTARLTRERLIRNKPGHLAADLIALGDACAAAPDLDMRSPNEIVGYDESGMW
jgi:antitoxin VapB